MKLNKSVKNILKSSDKINFVSDTTDFFNFCEKNFIEHLTIVRTPLNLIGQNCIVFLQTHLYRIKLLVKAYIHGLNANNPEISVLALRAIFETTGSLAYMHKKYNQYLDETITMIDFDHELERLYLGVKSKNEKTIDYLDPINVMKLIDSLDSYMKKYKNIKTATFRISYDELSERVHPNSYSYYLGHTVSLEEYKISFTRDKEIHNLVHFHLEEFCIAIKLYMEIYTDLKKKVEINEDIPFKETFHFKNY
ncbi:hypothetical protein [Jeotgalibacillus aurantiacus]|uniref:hypothetical protein n=1 Tax=Jeotgalibacillus aurantiacus TaxID=2763266 RepID=UPI001D0B1EF4|nr:hypothetical protein [Jeotgalibacillus aurantiacus]